MTIEQYASIYYTLTPDNADGAVLGIINVPIIYLSEKCLSINKAGGELFDVEFHDRPKADTILMGPTLVYGETVESYKELLFSSKIAYPNG